MRTTVRTIGGLLLAALLVSPPSSLAAGSSGVVGDTVLDSPAPTAPEPRTSRPATASPSPVAAADEQAVGGEADAPPQDEAEAAEPVEVEQDPAPDVAPDVAPVIETPPPVPDAPRPETDPTAADPDWRPEPTRDEILIDADEVYYHAGATVAEGNVVVRYRDITITSEIAEIDEDGVLGQFRGDVVITHDGRETTAELIRLNFETERWEVLDARTVLEPTFFERGVAEPIYVRADTITGVEDEDVVEAFDGVATSCDLDRPHYGFHSEHIRVIDDSRVVLEKPAFRVFGHTIFRYPWDMVLSQRSPHNRLFPEFGQNTVEGFYAKFAYLYLTRGDLDSFVRLHLTERRGIGAGADHSFRTGPHSGEASLFIEPDRGAFNSRVRHRWEISDRLDSNLNLSLQQNSGFAGTTTALAGNLNLRHRADNSDTTLGLDRSLTESAHSTSGRFGANLNHRQRMGTDASWTLRTTLRRSEFGAARSPHETLRADFRYQQRRDWFDWALAADDEWYLDSDRARSYGLSRLPEIVLNTDSRRLGNWRLPGGLPFRASVKTGRLIQYPDEDEITFAALESNIGGERTALSRNVTLTTAMSFNQAFYSDNAARYVLSGTLGCEADLGSNFHARLSHRAATVDGFSPLRRDYAGVYNDSSLSVVHQRLNASRFELTGGYDFVDDRWRELRLRGWMTPSRTDRIELMAGYALERSIWRPLQVRWTHATPWEIHLALSTRYNLEDDRLDSANLDFDWRVDDLWRLQGITTYSGQRDEFRNVNVRVTRDLHCWVASLTYNHDLNELRLNLGIKAFPFEDRDWTLGRTGARLGSQQQYYY